MHPVTTRVREQYERYPYPDYPWWFRPRIAEAWMASPAFCRQLSARFHHPYSTGTCIQPRSGAFRVLVAGCGTMQPFLASHWADAGTELHFLDLSARSLRQARLRLRLRGLRHHWYCDEIGNFLRKNPGLNFDHFDCYGVLHHLENPEEVLRLLSLRAAPGATLRAMIYNSTARNWIHHIRDLFFNLGLKAGNRQHLEKAGTILRYLEQLPNLRALLSSMERQKTRYPSLVDTFFHPCEQKVSPDQWIDLLNRYGFCPAGLCDRYGELDDLENPLLKMPGNQDLLARCRDRRFENNLELFAFRRPGDGSVRPGISPFLDLCPPPGSWFNFRETKQVSRLARRVIWYAFLRTLKGVPVHKGIKKYLQKIPLPALQRLSRAGALLPELWKDDPGFLDELRKPMAYEMEAPSYQYHSEMPEPLMKFVDQLLRDNSRDATEQNHRTKDLISSNLSSLLHCPDHS